jgi:hypothetical protein
MTTEYARHMNAATDFLTDAIAAPSGQRYSAAYGHAALAERAAWTSAERGRAGVLLAAIEAAGAKQGYRFN